MLTIDGGSSWFPVTKVVDGEIFITNLETQMFYMMKQTKAHSNVYRSVDVGKLCSFCSNGISNTNKRRILIVTPSNPEVIYALFSNNGWGFHGLYKSSDGGNNWALQSDTPNILGRDTDGRLNRRAVLV